MTDRDSFTGSTLRLNEEYVETARGDMNKHEENDISAGMARSSMPENMPGNDYRDKAAKYSAKVNAHTK